MSYLQRISEQMKPPPPSKEKNPKQNKLKQNKTKKLKQNNILLEIAFLVLLKKITEQESTLLISLTK